MYKNTGCTLYFVHCTMYNDDRHEVIRDEQEKGKEEEEEEEE